jgi:hypothetical protein
MQILIAKKSHSRTKMRKGLYKRLDYRLRIIQNVTGWSLRKMGKLVTVSMVKKAMADSIKTDIKLMLSKLGLSETDSIKPDIELMLSKLGLSEIDSIKTDIELMLSKLGLSEIDSIKPDIELMLSCLGLPETKIYDENLVATLQSKRNTPHYIHVLETIWLLPIADLRKYYAERVVIPPETEAIGFYDFYKALYEQAKTNGRNY